MNAKCVENKIRYFLFKHANRRLTATMKKSLFEAINLVKTNKDFGTS